MSIHSEEFHSLAMDYRGASVTMNVLSEYAANDCASPTSPDAARGDQVRQTTLSSIVTVRSTVALNVAIWGYLLLLYVLLGLMQRLA